MANRETTCLCSRSRNCQHDCITSQVVQTAGAARRYQPIHVRTKLAGSHAARGKVVQSGYWHWSAHVFTPLVCRVVHRFGNPVACFRFMVRIESGTRNLVRCPPAKTSHPCKKPHPLHRGRLGRRRCPAASAASVSRLIQKLGRDRSCGQARLHTAFHPVLHVGQVA